MPKIAIICFDSVTDIDVFLHWDILNRPRTMFPVEGEHWEVCLLGSAPEHTTQAGLRIPMHGQISECSTFDAVVHASGPATRELMRDSNYLSALSLSTDHQYIASQCSGALILAASGCLSNLPATTYPSAKDDLESFGIEFREQPLVAHERIATAAGCLAGIQLDAWLLAKFLSSDRVADCVNSAQPWGSDLN